MHLGKCLPGILRSLLGGLSVRSELPHQPLPPLWLACSLPLHATQLLWALTAPPLCTPWKRAPWLLGYRVSLILGSVQAESSPRGGLKQPLPSGTSLAHSRVSGSGAEVHRASWQIHSAYLRAKPLPTGQEQSLGSTPSSHRDWGLGVTHTSEAHPHTPPGVGASIPF